MINPKLNSICKIVDRWCKHNNAQYDIVCDETDLQGVMLFRKKLESLNDLMSELHPSIVENNIHVQTKNVRGGVVMVFSLNAIAESKIGDIIKETGEEEIVMSFKDKINSAFTTQQSVHNKIGVKSHPNVEEPNFISSATALVKEAQRKTANTGMHRGMYRDNSVNDTLLTKVQKTTKGATKGATRGANKGSGHKSNESIEKFAYSLNEALDGLATSDGRQPEELFKTFARALRVLGTKMGVGPLQDMLKQQGISWKQSNDGQSIILTVKNATTNVDQPIASINYETLQNPSDFELQLKNMMDLATGQAPGSFKQQEQEIQDRKKAIGDIARAIKPQSEQDEVVQQMNKDISPEEAAAMAAASPKQ
jgi:hypothetical protein